MRPTGPGGGRESAASGGRESAASGGRESAASGGRESAASGWLEAAAFGALAFGVRVLTWPTVFTPDGIRPVGFDAYYHLRRIWFSAVRFPESLDFDPYLNFPFGGQPIWSPLFDRAAGGIVALASLGREVDAARVEAVAIWIPPLLGAITVALLHAVVRAFFGRAGARAAALVLCLFPAHVWYSQLGFVDHHVAEALAALLLAATALALLRGWLADPPAAGGTRRALLHGAALGGAVLVWPGCLLHVGLVELGWFAAVVLLPASAARRAMAQLGLAHAAAFALVWPAAGTEWQRFGSFTPVVLSDFQPWFFGTLVLFHAGCAVLWRGAASAGRRVAGALVLGASLLALGVLAWPGLLGGAGDALAWLFKGEDFQARVAESRALWRFGGLDEPSWRPVLDMLTLLAFAVPLLGAAAFLGARERAARVLCAWLALWSLAWLAAGLLQARFTNSAGVAFALLVGASAPVVLRALAPRLGGAARAGAVAGLVLALLLTPAWTRLAQLGAGSLAAVRGEPAEPGFLEQQTGAGLEVARWLAAHSPPTAGYLDPGASPEYGVLPDINLGHLVIWEARRPSLIGNFGDDLGSENYALWKSLPALAEEPAVALLDERGIRYLIHEGRRRGARPAATLVATRERMGPLLRTSPPRAADARFAVPGLARHRLVYESAPLEPAGQAAPSFYRVFERVAGAVIEGAGTPGETVEVRLPVRSNRGIRRLYRRAADVDPDGRYRVRVAYPTDVAGEGVTTAPAYEVRCGETPAVVTVPEEAVTAGDRVPGPDCRPPLTPDSGLLFDAR